MVTEHSQSHDEKASCYGFVTGRAVLLKDRLTHLWDTLEPHRLTQGEQQADGLLEKRNRYQTEWESYFYKGTPLEQVKSVGENWDGPMAG